MEAWTAYERVQGRRLVSFDVAALAEVLGLFKGQELHSATEKYLHVAFDVWRSGVSWDYTRGSECGRQATAATTPVSLFQTGPEVIALEARLKTEPAEDLLGCVPTAVCWLRQYYDELMRAPTDCKAQGPQAAFQHLALHCFPVPATVAVNFADVVSDNIIVELKVAEKFLPRFITETIVHVTRMHLLGKANCSRAVIFRQLPKVWVVTPPFFELCSGRKVDEAEVRRMAICFLNFFGSRTAMIPNVENIEDTANDEDHDEEHDKDEDGRPRRRKYR